MSETTTEVTGTRKTLVIIAVAGVVLISGLAVFVPDSREFATQTVQTLLGFVQGIAK